MESQHEPLNFDSLAPYCESFQMGGKTYWLHEASEGDSVQYQDTRISAARMVNGKVVGLQGIAKSSTLLVHLCLYNAGSDGHLTKMKDGEPDTRTRVPSAIISKWPAKVVAKLFDRAKKISGLDERDETEETLVKDIKELQERLDELRSGRVEDEEKNEPDDTTTT